MPYQTLHVMRRRFANLRSKNRLLMSDLTHLDILFLLPGLVARDLLLRSLIQPFVDAACCI